jgi:hypothetical protein
MIMSLNANITKDSAGCDFDIDDFDEDDFECVGWGWTGGLAEVLWQGILTEKYTGAAIPFEGMAPDGTNIYPVATLNKSYRWYVRR